jgi:hypothetical protein
MTQAQTQPARRRLTLNRETVRNQGGSPRSGTALEMATAPCLQPPTDDTVGCMPSTWWCP